MTQDNAVSQTTSPVNAAPKTRLVTLEGWGRRYGEHLLLLAVGIAVLKYLGKDLAWPVLLLLVLVSLRDGLNKFLSRADTFKINIGNYIFTVDAGKVQELIRSSIDELTLDQKQLFLYICQNPEVRERPIGVGPLKFVLKKVRPRTNLHWDLRDLRALNLIRVLERGSLQEDVHILLTPFGKFVQETVTLGVLNEFQIEIYLRNRAQQDSKRDLLLDSD